MVVHLSFRLDHVLKKLDKLSMGIDKDTRAWCKELIDILTSMTWTNCGHFSCMYNDSVYLLNISKFLFIIFKLVVRCVVVFLDYQ